MEVVKQEKLYEVKIELEIGDFQDEKIYKFKKPNTASLDRYMKGVSNSMVRASSTFLKDNIVEEQRTQLENDLEEYPALVFGAIDKLLAILGMPKDSNLTRL